MAELAGNVLRGGSWNNNRDNARCANRNDNNPDNDNDNNGFVRRYTQMHIASTGSWYEEGDTRDAQATWRGNTKGKIASWESG